MASRWWEQYKHLILYFSLKTSWSDEGVFIAPRNWEFFNFSLEIMEGKSTYISLQFTTKTISSLNLLPKVIAWGIEIQ